MVPALTLNPSDNIALANCLASISVGSDFDCLGEGARDEVGRHWIGLLRRGKIRRTHRIDKLAGIKPELQFCSVVDLRSVYELVQLP